MSYTKTQRIIDGITDQIRSGALPSGAKLPSARELRVEYECSQQAVRTALDRLRAAGLVVTVPGVGAFVK